jgi:uncharacterized membrane protein YbjE (DUF340 family)
MAIDIFLYVSLAAGFVAGRLFQHRGPWVGRATVATIAVLVFLLGASLGFAPISELVEAIPIALLFAALILVFTVVIDLALVRRHGQTAPRRVAPAKGVHSPLRLPLALLVALLVGIGVGHIVQFGATQGLTYALYVLLALVGYDLNIIFPSIGSVLRPVTSAVLGGAAAAIVVTVLFGVPGRVAFATAAGFGWYTLTGPLVVTAYGPALGMVAFLVNFLRENLTMLSAPLLGPKVGGEGLVAMGGATSMDTTLYFATHFGDRSAGAVALSSGLILTIGASLLVPLILGLPG